MPAAVLETSGRGLNNTYQRKMVEKVVYRYARKILLPYPVRAVYTTAMSLKYIYKGVKTLLKGKIEVPVLDATAIGVSVLRNDIKTADSIMFLLGIGELLEEWTHKNQLMISQEQCRSILEVSGCSVMEKKFRYLQMM